jgi:hypothetical protein
MELGWLLGETEKRDPGFWNNATGRERGITESTSMLCLTYQFLLNLAPDIGYFLMHVSVDYTIL